MYTQLLETAIAERDKCFYVDLSRLDELGRIICFETCCTTHDGAPIIESKCFVDESDVPPIDTWFFLKNSYYRSGYRADQTLFCWIPKQFLGLMDDAIRVEFLDSYSWLDQNDPIMHDLIKTKTC